MESSTFVSAPIKGALKQFKVELRIYLAYTVHAIGVNKNWF